MTKLDIGNTTLGQSDALIKDLFHSEVMIEVYFKETVLALLTENKKNLLNELLEKIGEYEDVAFSMEECAEQNGRNALRQDLRTLIKGLN